VQLSMSCSVRLEQRTELALLQALEISGGATRSVFPRAEALLLSKSDYQKALTKIAARKRMNRYHSVMDFLLCELFPPFQPLCRAFYRGEGAQLREQVAADQLAEADLILVKALEIAHRLWLEDQRKSWAWTSYRNSVHHTIVLDYRLGG